MIQYPRLNSGAKSRQKLELFKGLNRRVRIGSGEFSDMANLSSDDYPVLSPRGKRGNIPVVWNEDILGMRYVPDKGLFYVQKDDDTTASLRLLSSSGKDTLIHFHWLNTEPKQLVVMGAYLTVFPDRKWHHMDNFSSGEMEHKLLIDTDAVRVIPCLADGTVLADGYYSSVPPEDNEKYTHWLDFGVYPSQIKRYDANRKEWVVIETTFVCLKGPGLEGHRFLEGDGILISGLGEGTIPDPPLQVINGYKTVFKVPSSDSIIVKGVMTGTRSHFCNQGSVRIERSVPHMDFVVECGNRLWGCCGDTNELYGCKLGDFNNWNCFQELSTDSWVVSVGTPGEFTGAVVQNGYPIFYKESCKYKVWPSATGAHQVTTLPCEGVQKNCGASLAVWEGTVFYLSAAGVRADDGGGPVDIGQCLGRLICESAAGCVCGQKYYLCLKDLQGKYELLVYDLEKRLWHREDNAPIDGFAVGGGSLYGRTARELLDLTGRLGTPEETVSWMAVTGDLGLELPEQKYISRLTLRLSLDPGATLEIFAQYDREAEWVKLGQLYGTDLRSFSLPVRPRRCDQLRLKLQGTGMCKLYSITKTLEKGSELL